MPTVDRSEILKRRLEPYIGMAADAIAQIGRETRARCFDPVPDWIISSLVVSRQPLCHQGKRADQIDKRVVVNLDCAHRTCACPPMRSKASFVRSSGHGKGHCRGAKRFRACALSECHSPSTSETDAEPQHALTKVQRIPRRRVTVKTGLMLRVIAMVFSLGIGSPCLEGATQHSRELCRLISVLHRLPTIKQVGYSRLQVLGQHPVP
jgi:hypothetical protein